MASNDHILKAQENEELIGEPLDTLQIQVNYRNGVKKTVPALSIGFMEVRKYVQFHPPPVIINETENSLSADDEEWLARASYLEDDLLWLLKLPYHRFWSQVVYDESLGACLDSYLSKAPREHDFMNLALKNEIKLTLKNIHRLVFLVFLRTSTYKESKTNHMRRDTFGNIIYENYLFDVPKIMDICVLYGIRNQQIVSKMIQNIFSSQPKYANDLNEAARIALFAFDTAEEMLFVNDPSVHGGALKLEGNNKSGVKEMSLIQFQDILSYITDTSVTLHAFLEVYPLACFNFYQSGAAARIVSFYEQVFPAVEKDVKIRSHDEHSEKILKDIKMKVSLSKTSLVKVFRNLVDTCCLQQILQSVYSDNIPEKPSTTGALEVIHVEDFFSIFTEIVTEKYFLRDYNNIYPFDDDVELLTGSSVKLDPERLSYIFAGIHDIPEMPSSGSNSSNSHGARPKSKESKLGKTNTSNVKGLHDVAALLKSDKSQNGDVTSSLNTESKGLNEESELDSLVQQMHDILPTYKKDFITSCLLDHNCNLEEAISAVFNGWQPPQERLHVEQNGRSSILNERISIFDGDEFDVFSREDVDVKNIHIGKSNKTPQTYQNLSKDDDFDTLKSITTAYAAEEKEYFDNYDDFDVYNDEYDDTYDSMLVGVNEPIAEGEPEKEEPEVKKETEEEQRNTSNRLDFCENPELQRQRYEERRQSQAQARNKPGFRRGDVPQTSQTNSRQNKDRHKAQAANHSRRKQADYKKSRGMI